MGFRITFHPSNHTIDADDGETILAAALRCGLHLPYACRNGACGACKAMIDQGMVDHGNAQPHALSVDERNRGLALLCCAKPLTDVTVEIHELRASGDIAPRIAPCRVDSLDRITEDVAVLRVKLPADERLMFLPGQYVDILMADGQKRSYSMANPPHDDGYLEFHIRHVPGGAFTSHVFSGMKVKDILRFEGPHGNFFLREESDRPILMLATGTGFAPVKSMLEHAFHIGLTRPIHFYWGGRHGTDLYMLSLLNEWQNQPNFRFVPVLSRPDPDWAGRTGHVQDVALADFPDLEGFQVYACGAPSMVEAAHRALTGKPGLPADEFYSDAFYPASPAS
jgi:CDP-4-dehydro-6-deoxyglucose reductase, E3